jgi:CubicO group peptidase (beta-lactamase class C family)
MRAPTLRFLLATMLVTFAACMPPAGAPAPPAAAGEGGVDLLARAAALELPGEWQPPPGDALEHSTAGFAKILCSAVVITGLEPADAAANVGYFTSPPTDRVHVTDTVIDFERRAVHLTLPSRVTRSAKLYGSQGCVALPIGRDSVFFTPTIVPPRLAGEDEPWPAGDAVPRAPLPRELDAAKIAAAVEAAFEPAEALTSAFVVTYNGRIIGERYGAGIGMHTPLESWSMGKSVTGTLLGVLIEQGAYELWQPVPIPEWQRPGDARRAIRIGDIMRMSSGIRIRAPQDPGYDAARGYPDHLYLYTGTINSFEWAATRPLQWPPNTVGRYRNTDPVLANYLIRLAVEARGEDYHAFPQRALFDKLGIGTMVLETDPYGNFLTQGYEFASGRDWARLGNLYLQDGVWHGERILPEGYVRYARTPAPAWVADGRPVYGGAFFWINGTGSLPVPRDAFYMAGAGGQNTIIIPSHGLVVVRLGKYAGSAHARRSLHRALELLMEAVPALERRAQ